VTAAERETVRGHAAGVVLLPPGSEETAYAVERLLFDRGWQVHVISEPEHLGEAVRTACAAGFVAIVVPRDVQEGADAEAVAGSMLLLKADDEMRQEDPAREISRRLTTHTDPLTGGAGI
jgi:hypothetical protein